MLWSLNVCYLSFKCLTRQPIKTSHLSFIVDHAWFTQTHSWCGINLTSTKQCHHECTSCPYHDVKASVQHAKPTNHKTPSTTFWIITKLNIRHKHKSHKYTTSQKKKNQSESQGMGAIGPYTELQDMLVFAERFDIRGQGQSHKHTHTGPLTGCRFGTS